MVQQREVDPFDAAMQEQSSGFAGKLTTYAWICVLIKGQGKVPYDPVAHKDQRTSTAIDLTVEPLDPTHKLIERNMLNWTPDFTKIVRPSLEALAPKIVAIRGQQDGQINPLKAISGLYVVGTYVERPDNKPDETWTTLRIDDVFETEAECAKAFEAIKAANDPFAPQPGDEEEIAQATAMMGDNGSEPQPKQKDPKMAAFLPGLWAQAGKDVTKLAELLDSTPMMAGYTIADQEVQDVVNS